LKIGERFTSLSYFVYNFSNSSPQQSANPGASLGQNNDHCPLVWTLSIKRSGIQRAKKRSRARFSSYKMIIRISFITGMDFSGGNLIRAHYDQD